jgi:hypothetical protein
VDQCFARGTHQLRSSAALRFSKGTGQTRNGTAPELRTFAPLPGGQVLFRKQKLGNNCFHFGGGSAFMIGRI